MKEWDIDDKQIISANMIKYGGSFFRIIGKAIKHADLINFRRLAKTFAKEFTMYYEWND